MSAVTPEGHSRAFWAWFAAKHPAQALRELSMIQEVVRTESEAAINEEPIPKTRTTDTVNGPRQGRGYAITGSGQRRKPSAGTRLVILERQRSRCLYCDNQFGTIVRRRARHVTLQLNWDHFVPYSYGLTNGGNNWVAACHVCNGIKSSRMFETVGRARQYILDRWIEKGYDLTPVLTLDEIYGGRPPIADPGGAAS